MSKFLFDDDDKAAAKAIAVPLVFSESSPGFYVSAVQVF